MNIKRVAQALRLQESLTADELMMLKVLQALTPTERELLVGSLQPEKVAKKRKVASKSPRAASLATAIAQAPKGPATAQPGYDPNAHCQKSFDGGFICDEAADANVHHLRGATGYHPFVASTTAQPARNQSSPNGKEQQPAASSATNEVGAGVAARGSSE